MGSLFRGSIGRRVFMSLASATAAVLGVAAGAGAAAVNAPYADNFNADTSGQNPPNFTSTNGTWAVSSGTYQNSIATTIAASSTIQVNNLGGGSTQGFSESATVSTDATGQGNSNYFFGLAALGQVADV